MELPIGIYFKIKNQSSKIFYNKYFKGEKVSHDLPFHSIETSVQMNLKLAKCIMYLVPTTLGLTQRILQRLENLIRFSGEKVASTKIHGLEFKE